MFQALSKNVLGSKLAGTGSRAPVVAYWAIMSVPIWLTSGVCLPAIAVVSFDVAWSQATGVTLTVTPGLSFMNASARTVSFTPSLPIAHTVRVPPTEPAGLSAGAWLATGAPPPDAAGALLAVFVPQAATMRPSAARIAAARRGVPRARLLQLRPEGGCGRGYGMSYSCAGVHGAGRSQACDKCVPEASASVSRGRSSVS